MSDLWGGRFTGGLSQGMREFSTSLHVDRRLVRQDLVGTRAHVDGLQHIGVLSDAESNSILNGIEQIEAEVEQGTFPPPDDSGFEDVHSAIQDRLIELCGEAGKKVHTGRSRNDQVVTATLLWLKKASHQLEAAVVSLQEALAGQVTESGDLVIHAYTHLQRAQPVRLADHLMAHHAVLDRDVSRIRTARERADVSVLGASACAGSSLPLDREFTAERLGFATVAWNTIDAVGARDWAIEFVSVCASVMSNLSRIAEELVLWSSQEFSLVKLGDEWSTGSSAMPHKRNPDVAELIRGRAAIVIGNLTAIHTLVKSLPLAYNRDLQEDKGILFQAFDITESCCLAMSQAIASATFSAPRQEAADFTPALDLAEELVRRGVPFKDAHATVGGLVKMLEERGDSFADLTEEELSAAGLDGVDRSLLTARGCVEGRSKEMGEMGEMGKMGKMGRMGS